MIRFVVIEMMLLWLQTIAVEGEREEGMKQGGGINFCDERKTLGILVINYAQHIDYDLFLPALSVQMTLLHFLHFVSVPLQWLGLLSATSQGDGSILQSQTAPRIS
jgi:hypothetical protein